MKKAKSEPQFAKCKVCRKIWNVSAMAEAEDGKYICPNCKFKGSRAR